MKQKTELDYYTMFGLIGVFLISIVIWGFVISFLTKL